MGFGGGLKGVWGVVGAGIFGFVFMGFFGVEYGGFGMGKVVG